jgi:coronin-1B/1C/6
VIPVSEVGKAPDTVALIRGHKGPILDTAFNPFNKQQIVSCSDDGKICLWEIPEDFSFHKNLDDEDNIKDITEPVKVLSGHTRKVGHVQFHPCAENVVASSSLDYTVKLWNLTTGKAEITLQHKDLVTCFAFNYNGSLLATTSRDKIIRIWDIRSGKIISEGPGHTGAKPARVVWLGNTDRIVTSGFSKLSDRQIGIWDVNDISKGAIDGFLYIDSSSGVLIPFFDESTSMLYLAGKGDGNIRYFEYENDNLYELSQYSSTDAQRGFAIAPKNSVNVRENEVIKAYKTVGDSMIEPISFIVPRRSELFQEDIYPDAPSDEPAISAEEWFDGKEVNGPILVSMESIFEGSEPKLRDSSPASSVSEIKKVKAEEKEKEQADAKKQEESKKQADEIKKTEETKPEVKDTVSDKSVLKESTPARNVDETLKGSTEVDSLLNKVNDLSDDEDNHNNDSKDDDWEEVKKPEHSVTPVAKTPPKETEQTDAKPEEPKKAETAEIKPVTNKETKSITPEVETKINPVAAKSESAGDSNPVKASTGAPTLKATVEKLAGIASQLETQIQALTAAGIEKDTRLAALEEKIEQLLKK